MLKRLLELVLKNQHLILCLLAVAILVVRDLLFWVPFTMNVLDRPPDIFLDDLVGTAVLQGQLLLATTKLAYLLGFPGVLLSLWGRGIGYKGFTRFSRILAVVLFLSYFMLGQLGTQMRISRAVQEKVFYENNPMYNYHLRHGEDE